MIRVNARGAVGAYHSRLILGRSMTMNQLDRRVFLTGASAAAVATRLHAAPAPALLTVNTRQIEVKGRAATVYGVQGPGGELGYFAKEGDVFAGRLHNATRDSLVMHWHGQVFAPAEQDRSREDGGELGAGASDEHNFRLTPGTHWMHAHQLTEQQLLAAPMVTREAGAPDTQEVVLMLHDFAFRSPAEILRELGGGSAHGGHGGMAGPGGGMGGSIGPMGNMGGMMGHGMRTAPRQRHPLRCLSSQRPDAR